MREWYEKSWSSTFIDSLMQSRNETSLTLFLLLPYRVYSLIHCASCKCYSLMWILFPLCLWWWILTFFLWFMHNINATRLLYSEWTLRIGFFPATVSTFCFYQTPHTRFVTVVTVLFSGCFAFIYIFQWLPLWLMFDWKSCIAFFSLIRPLRR